MRFGGASANRLSNFRFAATSWQPLGVFRAGRWRAQEHSSLVTQHQTGGRDCATATRAPAAERQFFNRCDNTLRHCRRGHASDCAHFGSRQACVPVCWGSDMHFGARVSQTFVMQISLIWKQVVLAGLLALGLVSFAGVRMRQRAGRRPGHRLHERSGTEHDNPNFQ